MTPKIVSPMEFIAIAERLTPSERVWTILLGVGLIHDGQVYQPSPVDDDDAATAVERTEAKRRAMNIGREKEPTS